MDNTSAKERKSGWVGIYFVVSVNKNSEKGKDLIRAFEARFKKEWNKALSNPNKFTIFTTKNGQTINIERDPLYDD